MDDLQPGMVHLWAERSEVHKWPCWAANHPSRDTNKHTAHQKHIITIIIDTHAIHHCPVKKETTKFYALQTAVGCHGIVSFNCSSWVWNMTLATNNCLATAGDMWKTTHFVHGNFNVLLHPTVRACNFAAWSSSANKNMYIEGECSCERSFICSPAVPGDKWFAAQQSSFVKLARAENVSVN